MVGWPEGPTLHRPSSWTTESSSSLESTATWAPEFGPISPSQCRSLHRRAAQRGGIRLCLPAYLRRKAAGVPHAPGHR